MSNAQINNLKTQTVQINGNCDMCEKTIEKAGNLKNQATVDWDKETKIAMISFDSLKTTKEEILKRVALAGYDNEIFLAPDDTYQRLPKCCQYERSKEETAKMKEANMDMAKNDHSMYSVKMAETQKSNALLEIFDCYFAIKNALVKSDGETASANAKKFLNKIGDVKMNELPMDVHNVWMMVMANLKKDSKQIADTNEIATQRNHFIALSENMYQLLKVFKLETPTYYQHCPMANEGKGANWLSKEEVIKNPYYGAQMLGCGKTVDSIK
jgi:copper chaperone CopZ